MYKNTFNEAGKNKCVEIILIIRDNRHIKYGEMSFFSIKIKSTIQ